MEHFVGHVLRHGHCDQFNADGKKMWAETKTWIENHNKEYPNHQQSVMIEGPCSGKEIQSQTMRQGFTITEFSGEGESIEAPEAWGGVNAMHMITHHGKHCVQVEGAAVRKAAEDKKMEAWVSKDGNHFDNGTCCNAGPKWCTRTFEHTKSNGMHVSIWA